MDWLGRPRSDVLAYTLPGFATSDATRANAKALMGALGVTGGEIDIRPAARQMLADLDHPFARGELVYDVTFENVQAGLRTDYLFRIANQRGGLVVGTGDLSELALGWCTYGVGDHMSHYNVSLGAEDAYPAPHPLRRRFRRRFAQDRRCAACGARHRDFPRTRAGRGGRDDPVDPASGRPLCAAGFQPILLDALRIRPSRIAYLAERAWGDVARGSWPADVPDQDRRAYSRGEILHWLRVFLTRFFANQFKRSTLPDGPKISSGGSLSPRGDWRAPSDANVRVWLEELDAALSPEG